jgi:hypothetical protein
MEKEFFYYGDKTDSFVSTNFLLAGGKDPGGVGRIMQVDEFGKVFVSDGDIERIAQRIAELLKPHPNRAHGL